MVALDRTDTLPHGRDEDENLKGPAASGEASQLPSSLKL
jgi:hypothetical protein